MLLEISFFHPVERHKKMLHGRMDEPLRVKNKAHRDRQYDQPGRKDKRFHPIDLIHDRCFLGILNKGSK